MAVTVNDVSASIRGVTVLDHVSATFENGRISGLVGPNGSGKTMLLRVIAGLVRPSGGTVSVDGATLWRDVSFPPDVGLLIESPHFLDDRTGLENLLILASIREVVGPEEVRDAISAFGLDPDDPRRFSKYSLGMKQRLGLAAAFMERPRTLLLGEPTNALDSEGLRLFSERVRSVRRSGAAVVVARILYVNLSAPHVPVEHHRVGERVELGGAFLFERDTEDTDGYSVTVERVEVLTPAQYLSSMGVGDGGVPWADEPYVLAVTMEVENEGNDAGYIDLVTLGVIDGGGDDMVQVDTDLLYRAYPQIDGSPVLKLVRDSEFTLTVPFSLKGQGPYFKEATGAYPVPFERGRCELVLSNQPVQKLVDLDV